MQKENQRIALTKRLLQEALLRLLEQMPLEKISITQLCNVQASIAPRFIATTVCLRMCCCRCRWTSPPSFKIGTLWEKL